MKASIIIAHDPDRSPVQLNKALLSINHELCEMDALTDFEVIIETEGSLSEAKNTAAQKAQAPILIFLDDDCQIRSGSLRELLYPFEDPAVGVVGGVNVAFSDISFMEHVFSSLFSSPFIMARSVARYTPRGNVRETDESEITSCIMAVRKRAFLAAGGFPLDVIPCEENVLINRIQQLQFKVIYNPFAIAFHKRPRSWSAYCKTIYHYGYGRGLMLRKGQGSPRMFWKPNRKWFYYMIGASIHYCSYIIGMAHGFIRNNKRKAEKSKWKGEDT